MALVPSTEIELYLDPRSHTQINTADITFESWPLLLIWHNNMGRGPPKELTMNISEYF